MQYRNKNAKKEISIKYTTFSCQYPKKMHKLENTLEFSYTINSQEWCLRL